MQASAYYWVIYPKSVKLAMENHGRPGYAAVLLFVISMTNA